MYVHYFSDAPLAQWASNLSPFLEAKKECRFFSHFPCLLNIIWNNKQSHFHQETEYKMSLGHSKQWAILSQVGRAIVSCN